MPWSNDQFTGELTIPTGATTGARITINHNGDGAIKVYDSTNTLIAEISAAVNGMAVMGSPGTVSATDAAGNIAELVSDIPGAGTLANFPGLVMQLLANTGDPATVGALDDGSGSNRALLLTSPSPVVGGIPGTDYSQIYMVGSDASPTQINVDAAIFQVNSATTFDANGIIDSYGADIFNTYTPAVGNGGTVTWSTRTGWWMRVGQMIFVNIYLVVNAAGSGAGIVTVDLPRNAYRGTRQTITMHTESVGPNGSHIGDGQAVTLVGGSGATIDRLRTSSNDATNRDQNITGADLLANGIITIQGWYREA